MEQQEDETTAERRALSEARVASRAHQDEAEEHQFLGKLFVGMCCVGLIALLVEVLRGESSVGLHAPLIGLAACAAALTPRQRVLWLQGPGRPRGYLAWHSKLALVGGAALLTYALIEWDARLGLIGGMFFLAGAGIWLNWRSIALVWYVAGVLGAGLAGVRVWEAYREDVRFIRQLLGAIFLWIMIATILSEVRTWSREMAERGPHDYE